MKPLTTEKLRSLMGDPHKRINFNGICEAAGVEGNRLRKRLAYGSDATEEELYALGCALCEALPWAIDKAEGVES